MQDCVFIKCFMVRPKRKCLLFPETLPNLLLGDYSYFLGRFFLFLRYFERFSRFSYRFFFYKKCLHTGFQVGPTFPIFLLFPPFLICSYFSLLLYENALLSLLFHSKMSFWRKNSEIFPRSLLSLRFYKLTSMFVQGLCRLTPQI